MHKNNGKGWLKAKILLSLKKIEAWSMTPLHDPPVGNSGSDRLCCYFGSLVYYRAPLPLSDVLGSWLSCCRRCTALCPRSGLMDFNSPECWAGSGCNMGQKLWTPAPFWLYWTPSCPSFQDRVKGHGTLQPERCNSMQIKPFTVSCSPVQVLENSFLKISQESRACEKSRSLNLQWQSYPRF